MNKLESALGKSETDYLTGTKELASGDLIVFGTLRSLEVSSSTLHENLLSSYPVVASWYKLMKEQVHQAKE